MMYFKILHLLLPLNTGNLYNSTLTALCHCERASKLMSPFIMFAVFDVSFRRYKL